MNVNAQKPLGYATAQASNRLSNGGACEVITSTRPLLPAVGSLPSKIDTEARALYLHPDPDADKLRARIRVLEAELKGARESAKAADQQRYDANRDWQERYDAVCAERGRTITERDEARNERDAESKRVGELQTQLDRIPAIPNVPMMPTNGTLTLNLGAFKVQVPICAYDTFETVVTGLAYAINGLPMSRVPQNPVHQQAQSWFAVWDALKGLNRCQGGESAEEGAVRTIRELRSAKEEQATEIDRLRGVFDEIHAATKKLPDLGALLTPARIEWAAAEIKRLRRKIETICEEVDALDVGALQNELTTWRKWGPFLRAFGAWRFHGADCPRHPPPTHGKRWRTLDDAWEGEANIPAPAEMPPRPAETAPVAASSASDGSEGVAGGSARPGGNHGPGTDRDIPPQCCGTCDAWEPDGTIADDIDGTVLMGRTSCDGSGASTGHVWGAHCRQYRPRGTIVDSARIRFPFVVRFPKPATFEEMFGDNCPLPADVDAWQWTSHARMHGPTMWKGAFSDWEIIVDRQPMGSVLWRVFSAGDLVAARECKTLEGGKRFAVKAARRAWRIHNA